MYILYSLNVSYLNDATHRYYVGNCDVMAAVKT